MPSFTIRSSKKFILRPPKIHYSIINIRQNRLKFQEENTMKECVNSGIWNRQKIYPLCNHHIISAALRVTAFLSSAQQSISTGGLFILWYKHCITPPTNRAKVEPFDKTNAGSLHKYRLSAFLLPLHHFHHHLHPFRFCIHRIIFRKKIYTILVHANALSLRMFSQCSV